MASQARPQSALKGLGGTLHLHTALRSRIYRVRSITEYIIRGKKKEENGTLLKMTGLFTTVKYAVRAGNKRAPMCTVVAFYRSNLCPLTPLTCFYVAAVEMHQRKA